MPSLIERLRGKAVARVQTAEEEYKTIVLTLANDGDYDDERVAEVLELTDRSIDTLDRNVREVKERIAARKVWDRWAKGGKQQDEKNNAELDRLNADKAKALADATAKINAQFDPKIAAAVELNHELQRVKLAAADAAVELTGQKAKPNPSHAPVPSDYSLKMDDIANAERHPEMLEPWPHDWN